MSARRGYFASIVSAARTTAEGMAVTLAQYFRRATTVQYPDRTAVPVVDSLPERYRGFLEVDMDICTACKACERDCPINVIAIDMAKVGEQRVMTRFDIDMGKCMYCGICVESCPIEAQAPGDQERTKCIRMTREFEGATREFPSLTFRFIRPGDQVAPFKPKKGVLEPTPVRGQIAREVRKKSAAYNAPAFRWSLQSIAPKSGRVEELVRPERLARRAGELAPMVAAATERGERSERKPGPPPQDGGAEGAQRGSAEPVARPSDAGALAQLLYDQALAQTDCEACSHPSCRDYAAALVSGRDAATWKCEPGGAQSTRDINLILELRAGKSPEVAAEVAAQVTRDHHR